MAIKKNVSEGTDAQTSNEEQGKFYPSVRSGDVYENAGVDHLSGVEKEGFNQAEDVNGRGWPNRSNPTRVQDKL